MAFAEDLSVFFNTAEFAVSATFTPGGGPALTANVLLDMPTETLWGNEAYTNQYAIVFKNGDLDGLSKGSTITVAGVQYIVREPVRLLDDGALRAALLSKV